MHLLVTAYEWYLVHKTPFEMLGLLLAVAGTVFAVLSIRDGRKLTTDLRSIFDHLTTKQIGAFPVYMQEVERLIGEARESVFIATEFPGHGVWADSGRYGAYVKALENRKADRVRKGGGLSVQVLSLETKTREKALHDRFPESRWKEYLKKGGYQHSKRLYEELENCAVPDQRAQFLDEISARQERALHADLRFADRWSYKGVMPIYLWIIDSEKAVFAIPSFGGEPTEYGFYTEESGLILALLSVWSRYMEAAEEIAAHPVLVKKSV